MCQSRTCCQHLATSNKMPLCFLQDCHGHGTGFKNIPKNLDHIHAAVNTNGGCLSARSAGHKKMSIVRVHYTYKLILDAHYQRVTICTIGWGTAYNCTIRRVHVPVSYSNVLQCCTSLFAIWSLLETRHLFIVNTIFFYTWALFRTDVFPGNEDAQMKIDGVRNAIMHK